MNRNFKSGHAALALSLALAASLAACGSSKKSGPSTNTSGTTNAGASGGSLTIGSADFTESSLLADIYGDALQARGVSVTKKLDIGERSVYWKALQDGSI